MLDPVQSLDGCILHWVKNWMNDWVSGDWLGVRAEPLLSCRATCDVTGDELDDLI